MSTINCNEFLIVIPARYDSTRLPGKALMDIAGKSLIQRVYEACSGVNPLLQVCVATDDKRIQEHVNSFQGSVFMTSKAHETGTDRIAELVTKFPEKKYVINVQGDEPFIRSSDIEALMACLNAGNVEICTLIQEMDSEDDPFDRNIVKVVIDLQDYALYFSRSAIPYQSSEKSVFQKHIGMYGFRRDILLEITKLPKSRYETMESLEQLRWLEHGYRIMTAESKGGHIGIDTPEDLELARSKFES